MMNQVLEGLVSVVGSVSRIALATAAQKWVALLYDKVLRSHLMRNLTTSEKKTPPLAPADLHEATAKHG